MSHNNFARENAQKAISQLTECYENSFQYSLCLTAVIVTCSYAVSNPGPPHTYEQREQATKTAVRKNISLGRSGLK